MSKLPYAPLLEVIYELRWAIPDAKDLADFQYLHGDLYNAQKQFYPFREKLIPFDIPLQLFVSNPIYRFRSVENGYPLFQLGPGVLSLNTVDEKYHWDDYFKSCKQLTNSFIEVYSKSKELKFKPSLIYVDFFEFDFEGKNIIDFINGKLNINFGQKFYQTKVYPESVSGSFIYKTKIGKLEVSFNTGKNQLGDEGLVLKTQLNGTDLDSNTTSIFEWLEIAHEFSINLFKEMTKGELYNSFIK